MRRKSVLILTAALVAVLVLALGALAVYAASRDDVIADGVKVGGVDVGGLKDAEARAKLQRALLDPLQEPLVVTAAGRRFTLTAKEARLAADLEGMVGAALDESRDGSFVERGWRWLSGGTVERDLPARVTYSPRALNRLIRRVVKSIDRKPADWDVKASGLDLDIVRGHDGRAVDRARLRRDVQALVTAAGADRTVRAHIDRVRPKVTRGSLEKRYPVYVTVDRNRFRLRLWKKLKPVKVYRIAVGQIGLETPAGLYHVQNKAINPAWHVPNSDWAGKLAGKVIPGGVPENPLKARWLGIYDGAGIHGTDAVGSLGTAASHGCVRMAVPDVIELFDQVPVGAPVYIA